ncbi:MAG: oligosaccharide flippase family protein [Candidatus Omnitrophota bacterium]|jgi:O-antigen/teichoic acid export membrane protein
MKITYLLKILKTRVSKHVGLVLAGNIFTAGLALISLLLIANNISMGSFGLFTIAISLYVIGPFLTSFGMSTVMITLVSSYLGKNELLKAAGIAKTVFVLRVTTTLAISLTMLYVAPFLANNVFQHQELTPLIRLAAAGVLSVSLFNQVKSTLYAYKLFGQYVALSITVELIKLFTLLILAVLHKINAASAMATFGFTPFIGIIFGVWVMPNVQLFSKSLMRESLPYIFRFSRSVFINDVAKQASLYMPIFMLMKLLDSKAAGIYGLALNLTHIFPIIINSFNSVFLPEISRFQKITRFGTYLRASIKILPYLFGAGLICLLFSGKFINLFFGNRYASSIPIFNWLLFSYIFLFIDSVSASTLYSLRKPGAMAFVSVAKLIIMTLGCYFLIPCFGITAPAILTLVLNAIITTILALYILKYIHYAKTLPVESALLYNAAALDI